MMNFEDELLENCDDIDFNIDYNDVTSKNGTFENFFYYIVIITSKLCCIINDKRFCT